MSYEGESAYICSNGHIHFYDTYDAPDEGEVCPVCGSPLCRVGSIDHTNGDAMCSFELHQRTPLYYRNVYTVWKGKTFHARITLAEPTFNVKAVAHYEHGPRYVTRLEPVEIPEGQDSPPELWQVDVHFDDGDYLSTKFRGTEEDVNSHYEIGREANVGIGPAENIKIIERVEAHRVQQ